MSYTSIVSGGMVISGETVSSYETQTILNGGITSDILVSGWSAAQVISSGGTAASTTVTEQGVVCVSSGGTVIDATVNSYGFMRVFSGGAANLTMVSRGYMYVSNGGMVTSTTVNSGNMVIYHGGMANAIMVIGGLYYFASNTAEIGGHLSVVGLVNAVTVNSRGYMYVSSGGVATSATVNSRGYMYVSSGGMATSTTVNYGGRMNIINGGTATDIIVSAGGSMIVSSGGTAGSTTIISGGEIQVYTGGIAHNTVICSGGKAIFSGDSIVSGITVVKGQIQVDGEIDAQNSEIIFSVDGNDGCDYFISNLSNIYNAEYTIDIALEYANSRKYYLADNADAFNQTITVKTANGKTLGTLSLDNDLIKNGVEYSLDIEDSVLTLSIAAHADGGLDTVTPFFLSDPQVVVEETSVAITWDDAIDNVGVAYYIVRVDDEEVKVFGNRCEVDIASGTTSRYQVIAVDEAGNMSKAKEGLLSNNLKWYTDFEDAKLKAGELGVPIIHFAGKLYNGYCPHARELIEQVFQQEDFMTYAATNSVVLYDAPYGQSLIGTSVPEVVIMDSDGNIISYRIGFLDGAKNTWMRWFESYVELKNAPSQLTDIYAPKTPSELRTNGNSISWHASSDEYSGVKGYILQISHDENFTDNREVETINCEYSLSELSDGNYYYRVKSKDNSGNESDWSETDSFTIDIPDTQGPSVPCILTIVVADNSVALDWDDSTDNKSGVKHYVVEYADNDSFADAESQTVLDSSLNLSNLPDSNYYWRVKAVDNAENASSWSSSCHFKIDITAPSTPIGLSESVSAGDAFLDWMDSIDNVSGVKEYIWEYATNVDFVDAVSETLISSNIELAELGDSTYYWRVKAIDNSGNESVWSDIGSFIIDVTEPSVPVSLNVVVTGNEAALHWNDSTDNKSGVKWYIIEYADNDNFADTKSLTVVESQSTLSNLSDNNYYWRVKAVDNAGNESDWTQGGDFLVDITAPTVPDNLIEVSHLSNTILNWDNAFDNVSGVKEYQVEYADNADFNSSTVLSAIDSVINISDLSFGVWFWRVKSVDCSDNWSEWSAPESFATGDTSGNSYAQAKEIDVDIPYSYNEYVGQGDACDMYCFDVASPGEFDLALTNLSSKAKVAIYTWDGKKYKKLKGANAKLDKTTGLIEAHIDNLMLDYTTYYLEVMSGDKGKGKCNTDYTLDITPSYFPEVTDNNSWQDATEIVPDVQLEGFVGFGDACDCYKFEVANLTSFDFDLTGEDKNAKLTVYMWDDNKGKLKKVKNGCAKLKYGNASLDNLTLDAGLYYVEVLSADKGKGKKNTEYDLQISQV